MQPTSHLVSEWNIANFEALVRKPLHTGSGRGVVQLVDHPKGTLVERQYRHGGLRRFIAASLFFKSSRAADEFDVHRRVYRGGVATVEPIGWREELTLLPFLRRYFYCTSLLPRAKTLPQVLHDSAHVNDLVKQGSGLIHRLFKLGVYHVDLNLNNWLVSDDTLYLIDFDKAKDVTWSAEDYLQRVVERLIRSGRKLGFANRRVLFFRFLIDLCAAFGVKPRQLLGRLKQPKAQVGAWERFRWKLSGGHQFS